MSTRLDVLSFLVAEGHDTGIKDLAVFSEGRLLFGSYMGGEEQMIDLRVTKPMELIELFRAAMGWTDHKRSPVPRKHPRVARRREVPTPSPEQGRVPIC